MCGGIRNYFQKFTYYPLAQEVQGVAAKDLKKMGLQIVSFTIKDLRDNNGYLEALAGVSHPGSSFQAERDRGANEG
ncbi:MAG: band 7 protein [Paenibacillaceae bacterium]|jgi:hypothetical protein|nr:band 7 protein [Paenibacillaceae bacterium]